MSSFSIVLAMTKKGGIGYQNQLPWKLKKDLFHFKQVTTQGLHENVVIMGRKTWQSMNCRPLPKRMNVVISRSMKQIEDALIFPSLEVALQYFQETKQKNKIFLIGGKQLIEEGMSLDSCSDVHLTRVGIEQPCDVYVDTTPLNQYQVLKTSRTMSENDINFDFQHLVRKGAKSNDMSQIDTVHEEQQYLDIIRKILETGTLKDDRTGVGTQSIFGETMRFQLQDSFPLLTTKKVFMRGVIEELLWFIKGQTDGHILLDKNVKIWEGNGSREYLDSINLQNRREHDLGPIYGFQWRHFGAEYTNCSADYGNQGVDQLKEVIHLLKTNPNSRRMIISAWNPSDLHKMALPPCHVLSQFYVGDGKLSCMMYQRSCDFGLGIPFNIASYALLTQMIAMECNLKLGEFIHVLGDTHIYQNHVESLRKQMERTPNPFPIMKIRKKERLEDYVYEDFKLIGYDGQSKLEMKMAV